MVYNVHMDTFQIKVADKETGNELIREYAGVNRQHAQEFALSDGYMLAEPRPGYDPVGGSVNGAGFKILGTGMERTITVAILRAHLILFVIAFFVFIFAYMLMQSGS